MTGAGQVPYGLADVPPGPELAALIARIDIAQVANEEIVHVLRAESRQLAHQQGRLFAAMAEVGRCERLDPAHPVARAPQPVVESIHEIGVALALTSNAAFAEHSLAEDLRARLPAVQDALLAGLIDRSKARLFVEYTRELTEQQTARICAQLLPLASRLTTGQLADRVRRLLLSIDPEALRKRYTKAVRDRAVFGYLDRDGTATVSASGLSPDEAASSCARVYDLARTIRRAGHPDALPQIRADLFVALLDGSLQQMTNAQIVLAMLARRGQEQAGVAGGEQRRPPGPAPAAAPEPVAEESKAGINVRVRLSTLLGLDEHPGEIPGWGAIPPQPAREVVARQVAGRWRFAITDAEGYLLLAGVTRRRPARSDEAVQNAGGTVELQVPVHLLRRLAAEPPPGWEPVIADLATQYLQRDELLAILRAHPAARFPHAALRRHIEVRDRTCVFPGCRRPAAAAQIDHTVEFQDGGATVEVNLGPLCFPHHWLKSLGGWRLHQPLPGRFTWRSPLGGTYRTRGEPITPPLPEPVPGEPECDDLDHETGRRIDDHQLTGFGRPPPGSVAIPRPEPPSGPGSPSSSRTSPGPEPPPLVPPVDQ